MARETRFTMVVLPSSPEKTESILTHWAHEAYGSISTPVKASSTRTPLLLPKRSVISADPQIFQRRCTLDRVTAFTATGR